MDVTRQIESEQTRRWNGAAGRAWVDAQPVLDRMFQPLEDLLVETLTAGPVLDVGCGTGATTLAAARKLGAAGGCVGIDISDPMITCARARAAQEGSPARFVCGDAQAYAFVPASFAVIQSRFGVMFFDDPVAAFANLRRAAAAGARLRFIAWRSAGENPFMTTAERAAAPLLPDLPVRGPDGPGQFGFSNTQRVEKILDDGGWADIDIRPIDVACALPETELVRYVTRLGPVGLILQEADETVRGEVGAAVRAAFDPYVHGPEVRFMAACWMVTARRSRV